MKIVQINSTCGVGSTGKICVAISRLLTEKGIENYIFYAFGKKTYSLGIRYMSLHEIKLQALKAKIDGKYGFHSKTATKRMIARLDQMSPDVVLLHNLHSHNVNLELLFDYLKKKNIKVFWTFHDCWAFTGYCPHYEMVKCEQWKTDGCRKCPQRRYYSWFFDNSHLLFEKKKKLFTGLDMTIITPSQWLASQVKQSFMSDISIRVINNGINLEVFYPRASEFRKTYGLEDKFIVLGVAFGWGARKGLDVFIELANKLDSHYQVVLVGTNKKVDKLLPNNIISIHRTDSQEQLAEIYSAADVLVNATREDTFPTVNIEAIACGIPVITFKTGGSPEIINDKTGIVVEYNDSQKMIDAIKVIDKNRLFSSENCISHALNYSDKTKYQEYIEIITT